MFLDITRQTLYKRDFKKIYKIGKKNINMNSKKISFANLSFIHEKAGLRGWVETVCESACWTRTRRVITS